MFFVLLFVISLGLALLFAELFVVPGVTFVGIAGALLLGVGVWQVYEQYGAVAGHISLLLMALASTWVVWKSLKTRFWRNFELVQQIESKSSPDAADLGLIIGQEGKTITALRPQGTVKFGQMQVEVESVDGWIDQGKTVVISFLEGKKIFIKSK